MDTKQYTELPLLPGCIRKCPACPHRGWPLERSLQQKSGYLRKSLSEWQGPLREITTLRGDDRWGYRQHAVLHTSYCNGWRYGLRCRDEIIHIPDCPVHHPFMNQCLSLITNAIPPSDSFPLRFIVVSGKQMTLILKTPDPPETGWLDIGLKDALVKAGLEGLWIHLHPSAGKRVFGKGGWNRIFGKSRSTDSQGLIYGPSSFQQLLPELYLKTLGQSRDFLDPSDDSILVDLYSGTGNSIRYWREKTENIIGVEWSGEAVECALENNPGIPVLCGLCKERLPQLREWTISPEHRNKTPLLYVNPPRTGLEKEVLDWITTDYRPVRMAYLSCSAGSLARDLGLLCSSGYGVKALQPYDFFPQTRHVECLALISRADHR